MFFLFLTELLDCCCILLHHERYIGDMLDVHFLVIYYYEAAMMTVRYNNYFKSLKNCGLGKGNKIHPGT